MRPDRFLTDGEVEAIHRNALRVLEAAGKRIELDAAREIALEFERGFVPASHISAEEERELRCVSDSAATLDVARA